MNEPQVRDIALEQAIALQCATEIIRRLEARLEELSRKIDERNQDALLTKEQLERIRAMRFGRSSERREGDQATEADSANTQKPAKKKRTKFGRKDQPNLALQDVHHKLAPESCVDPKSGVPLDHVEGLAEESYLITVIPTQFILQRHIRHRYRNPVTEALFTAPGPLKLKEGSRYSVEFAVHTGIQKYAFHLPLERQVRMAASQGLDIDSQTLFSQIDTVAWYLKSHVYAPIEKRVRQSAVKLADESPWGNLSKDAKPSKFYLWGMRATDAVCFRILDSRSKKAARTLLGQNISGILMHDGYAAYEAAFADDDIKPIHACCLAHLRRKFVQAEKSFPQEAELVMTLIRQLYDVEDEIRGLPPDKRLQIRTDKSKPVADTLFAKLCQWKNVLPKSSLGMAVAYGLKLWPQLTVFLTHPDCPLDNNAMEGAIRGPVVGRKNHYGSHNLKSAEVAAIWYSVIETAKVCRVDPRAYIEAALRAILTKTPVPFPWNFNPDSSA